MTTFTATYSPDDNKLRLYASTRLDSETYAQVRAAGFIWAPKQDLFVAPMWTPAREDLLIEIAGEIGDEDTSLVDRAEERADRFADYGDKRAKEAKAAHDAVDRIVDGIPLGQPILVGHHSERHARKDAERIRSGMTKAVKLWETSSYWKSRAAGAIDAAKYKERPDVRARRIKGIEADRRKVAKEKQDALDGLAFWEKVALLDNDPEKQLLTARAVAGRTTIGNFAVVIYRRDGSTYDSYWTAYDVLLPSKEDAKPDEMARYDACPAWTVQQVIDRAREVYPARIPHKDRWLAHYDNRLEYERAMLAEAGGTAADKFDIQPGGRVCLGGQWATVLKVNRSGGAITSVTTNARYGRVRSIEQVSDYEAPTDETAKAVAAANALGPLCNYPGDGFYSMTKAQWTKIPSDYKAVRKVAATDGRGAHRIRYAIGAFAAREAGVKLDDNKRHSYGPVYITDEKQKDAPEPAVIPAPAVPRAEPILTPRREPVAPSPIAEAVDAMRESLKAGIKVAAVPQLFPTPEAIAAEMVELAEIHVSHRVLEPSAGTGNIWRQLSGKRTAVEINPHLADRLRDMTTPGDVGVICGDFLECSNLGAFDRIVMNPPFENGADIKHIRHAARMLKPGGRLVAICANGPRQQEQLKPLASEWRDLPAGSFKAEGTNVNAALLVIEA